MIGLKLKELKGLEPIEDRVKIAQKTVRYTPTQKLLQAFAGLLAGAQGIVELNPGLRTDRTLQSAFGRGGCAEQSVIQETLDACTETNVSELETAIDLIFQTPSQAFGHDYASSYQILDVDMSGQPWGRKAECSTKGYFAKQRNRRGRQLGRVVASRSHEIVVDRLFAGTVQLAVAFEPLVEAAERTLGLEGDAGEARRRRTILRVDSGAGSVKAVNGALSRGYRYHGKDCSSQRAERLAESVPEWVDDPKGGGRQRGTSPRKRPITSPPSSESPSAVPKRKAGSPLRSWSRRSSRTKSSKRPVSTRGFRPTPMQSCWPTSTSMTNGAEPSRSRSRGTNRAWA